MIFKCLEFTNQTQGLGRDQVMDINRLPDSLVANMYRVTRKRIHRSDEPFAKIESRQVATCSWRKKKLFSHFDLINFRQVAVMIKSEKRARRFSRTSTDFHSLILLP